MASQKPASRGAKQAPVRTSPTARSSSADGRPAQSRQKSQPADGADAANGKTRQAGNGAAGAKPAGTRPATGAGATGTGSTRSGSTTKARPTAAAAVPAESSGGPRGLARLWAPFRRMGGVPLATLILSLYGLGTSVYLTIAHFDTAVTLVCSDKGLINCEEVTTSPQSMVFGVLPVAVLGLAFYVFMVAINSPWGWRLKWPAVSWLRFGSVIVGMGFVLYLIYAEVDQIKAICLWCTSVHVATFLIFVLLVFHTTYYWGRPEPASRD